MKPVLVLLILASFWTGQLDATSEARRRPPWDWCGTIFIWPSKPEEPPQPVPLTAVSVHADMRGWTVGVTAELEYRNVLNETIECQFVFPLVDTAAVYQLDAVIAGRKLTSEIKERTEAHKTYEEAVNLGQKVALLESQAGSPDIYRLKLGNLPPNETATIRISYVQPIDRNLDDGLLSMTLPVVLNPRYVPRHEFNDTDLIKEKFHITTPFIAVSEVKYRMSFSANVTLGLSQQIVGITARHQNDTLNVVYGEDKTTASVSLLGNFVQDHDFQLLITPSKSMKPTVYVEPGRRALPGLPKTWLHYDVAASWFESVKSPVAEQKKSSIDEYWIVIDRSGSMWGEKIKDAKSALILFVKSLPFGCKFNIVGFGSTYTVLFKDGIVDYSEENVKTAMQHTEELEADLGGTEVLEALKHIYQKPLRNDTTEAKRFIILITDGEVSNTEEVLALTHRNAATTRVFSVGIGEGASTALVNGVARMSNGLSEFVRSANDRLQAKVISLLKATTSPAVDNIKFEWSIEDGHVTSTVPKKPESTSVYSGGSVSQYAVIERDGGGKDVEGYAKFSAVYNGAQIENRLEFEIESEAFSDFEDTLPLHRLSAKRVLTELTDEYMAKRSEEVKKEAIAISIATGVLCEFTAFVAIDKDAEVNNVTAKKPLFINVQRPTAYAMHEMAASGRSLGHFMMPRRPAPGLYGGHSMMKTANYYSSPNYALPMPAAHPAFSPAAPPPPNVGMASMGGFGGTRIVGGHIPGGAPAVQAVSEDSTDDAESVDKELESAGEDASKQTNWKEALEKLIKLQSFKGTWQLTNEFVTLLDAQDAKTAGDLRLKFDEILSKQSNETATFKASDEFIATSAAVSFMRKRLANSKDEWQLIEQKAVAYLQTAGFKGDLDAFIDQLGVRLDF